MGIYQPIIRATRISREPPLDKKCSVRVALYIVCFSQQYDCGGQDHERAGYRVPGQYHARMLMR